MRIAPCVRVRSGMLSAVYLYDESALEADEIDDETVHRHLPLELHAVELLVSERLPEHVLGLRGIEAHVPGKAEMGGRGWPVRHEVKMTGNPGKCNF